MRYSNTINYYLSRNFKDTEAIELLNDKLEKFPYDYLKLVKFCDYDYTYFNQGANIDYRVDPEYPRNITVIMDVYDGMVNRKIILEIRYGGNEVNLITKAYKEDTKVFHIKYYRDSETINVLNKTIKFYNTDKEQTVKFSFAKFDKTGDLLDYKDSNSMILDSKNKVKRFR